MSLEIATLERVRSASQSLRDRGVKVTAERVIEIIGGGSKGTVLGHLKSLRDAPQEQDDVPPQLIEMIRPAVSAVFAAGRRAESDHMRATMDRLAIVVDEQDAQIQELLHLNTTLEQGRDALDDEMEKLKREVVELRKQLVLAQSTAAKDLTEAIRQVKSLAMAGSVGPGRRSTLTLPRRPEGRKSSGRKESSRTT
jgi:hypothetical protein